MSNVKLSANDTSLFSIVNCSKASASILNSDLLKIKDWTYQWKTPFNPNQAKQSQEAMFSRKTNKIVHPPLYFNNVTVNLTYTEAPWLSARYKALIQ